MATFALTDASVTINSVNLSAWVTSVTFPFSAEELDDTAMGDSTRSAAGGLKNWGPTIEFNQDFAAGGPDATIQPLVGTTTTISVRPTSSAVSSTNPNYTGTVLVAEYSPFGNRVGEQATCSVRTVAAGDPSRATA